MIKVIRAGTDNYIFECEKCGCQWETDEICWDYGDTPASFCPHCGRVSLKATNPVAGESLWAIVEKMCEKPVGGDFYYAAE